MIETEGIEQPEFNIAHVKDIYKYLGIPQADGNQYVQKVRHVLKSKLKGKNKVQAIRYLA